MRIKTNKPKNTYTSLETLYPDPGKKKKKQYYVKQIHMNDIIENISESLFIEFINLIKVSMQILFKIN